jgi:iron complex outermembrane receptor protein
MRGLGAGYTQLLIDGQRVPPGFSLESLTPEQIERIEIFRAPTAETGARAIGGTINIVTREGYKRRINDLRLGFGVERGEITPGLFWTRNDSVGDFIYTVSGGAYRNRRSNPGSTRTTETDLDNDSVLRDQVETSDGLSTRLGLNLTSRLQWRLGPADTLVLMPAVFHSQGDSQRHYDLQQPIGPAPALYASADSDGDNCFTLARLNSQWRSTLGSGLRLEAGANVRTRPQQSLRQEFDAAQTLLRTVHDSSRTRDRTALLTGKRSKLLDGEHSSVSGAELERLNRGETRSTEQNNRPAGRFRARPGPRACGWRCMRRTNGPSTRTGRRTPGCAGRPSARAATAATASTPTIAAACSRRCCMRCGSPTPSRVISCASA